MTSERLHTTKFICDSATLFEVNGVFPPKVLEALVIRHSRLYLHDLDDNEHTFFRNKRTLRVGLSIVHLESWNALDKSYELVPPSMLTTKTSMRLHGAVTRLHRRRLEYMRRR